MNIKSLALGFLAGAIAVVTVHELVKLLVVQAGLISVTPWSMAPVAITGVPAIVSATFWGGLWAALFAAIAHLIPGNSLTIKGLIFGVLGPALLGVFILVPLIKGSGPIFFGGAPAPLIAVTLILASWGAATGWLYGFLKSRA